MSVHISPPRRLDVLSPPALPEERTSRGVSGDGAGARHFLIATGTAHYATMPDQNLPSVATDLDKIVDVLTRQLGYQRVSTLGLDPTGAGLRLELSRFFRDADRRPDDLVIVYYAGHGDVLGANDHVLLPTDSDPAHLKATSVATADLAQLILEETVVRQVLVILDTCYAGTGADDLAVRAFASLGRSVGTGIERPGVVLLTATRPREVASPGVFAAAFAHAIDDLATAAYAPPDLAVGAVVGVLNRYLPAYQRARLHVLGELAGWLAELSGDTQARIVTGDPGSGKSAVLGRLVMLADPEYRPSVPLGDVAPETIPPAGAIDVVIHARNRTTEELRARLVAAAGIDADSVDALLAALGGNQRPLVVVLDALDEAADPARTTAELLGPLMRAAARGARLRLLVGTRRNLLPDLLRGLERTTVVLDLDTAAYLEEADVAEYARRCLLEATPKSPYLHASAGVVTAVAKAIASAAGQAFLVARIVSRSLAGESTVADPADPVWRANLPSSVGAAMEYYLRRFGADEQRIRDLL